MRGLSTSFLVFSILLFRVPPLYAELGSESGTTSKTSEAPATEVFVSGSLAPKPLESYNMPYTLITKDDLDRSFSSNISDIFNESVGIRSSSFAPGVGRPVIRGQGGGRVRVVNNGVAIGDISANSDDHSVAIDTSLVERAEVVRGPATLLYGGSAIGGLVNFIDNDIPSERIGEEVRGSVLVQKGDSASDLSSGSADLTGEVGEFQWRIGSFYRRTGNIAIPGLAESEPYRINEEDNHHQEEGEYGEEEEEIKGRLPNSDTLSKGFVVGGSKVHSLGYYGVSLRYFESQYGVPGHVHHGHKHDEGHEDGENEDHHHDEHHDHDEHHEEHDKDFSKDFRFLKSRSSSLNEGDEPGVAINLDQWRLAFHNETKDVARGIDKIKVNGAVSTYSHNEIEGAEVGTRFQNDTVETRLQLQHSPVAIGDSQRKLSGGGGLQINLESFQAAGNEAYLPDSRVASPALFLLEELELGESLVWQNSGRYEWSNIDPGVGTSERDGHSSIRTMKDRGHVINYSNRNFHLVSASTGLSGSFNKARSSNPFVYGLSLAYSERAPNNAELFANGAHTATRTFEIGDSSLEKERAIGGELTLRKKFGRFSGSASAFLQHYDDYLNLAPTGEEEDELPVFAYQMTRAQLFGGEIEGKINLVNLRGHLVDFVSSFDLVRGRNLVEDDPLPRMPPSITRVGFNYDYNDWNLQLSQIFAEAQRRVASFELPTDSYQQLNIEGGYTFPFEKASITTFVQGTNLTDEEIRNHISFTKDLFPQRGRAFLAGVKGNF